MRLMEWLMGWVRNHMRSWRERPREAPRCAFERRAVEMEAATTEFVASAIAPLERAWERLEDRTDFRADHERELLRPKLAAAYAERDEMLMVGQALHESAELRAELQRVHDDLERRVTAALERITGALEVPDAATVRKLWVESRELDSLRHVLFTATASAKFARPFDAVDRLRKHWAAQTEARSRVFSHFLAPGYRPTVPTPPWAQAASRLKSLATATERITPLKENHAS